MHTISAIEPGRRRGRFNVYVDGTFAVAVGERVIADIGLRVGQPFTAERLQEIAGAEEARRALESALRLLEVRQRASKEIEQRLQARGYEDNTITATLATLRRLELIDDAEFARAWVESRGRASPKGARMLRSELAQKGVAREQIDEAVAHMSPDNELELARQALRSKSGRGLPDHPEDRRTEYRRLASFLQRRGFGWDTVKAALAELLGRQDDDNETD